MPPFATVVFERWARRTGRLAAARDRRRLTRRAPERSLRSPTCREPVLPSTARALLARTARAQRDGRVPSLVAGVVRDGGLAWSAGRGEVPGPVTDVQYRLGSISKTVTAVAVMRLRDEGRLGLDDPLERHVPGTPLGDRTVGQLLSHLAGASAESPGGWWERVPGGSLADLRLREEHVVLGAARRFHYSNLGFGLLGELVARRAGPAVGGRRAATRCWRPLGMDRTTPRPRAARRRGARGAPVGRRRPPRARARRRGDGRRRSAVGDAGRPGPVRRLPARRHRRRAAPGDAGGDGGAGRGGPLRARLVGLRAGAAGAPGGRAHATPATAARCPASWPASSSTARSGPARSPSRTPPAGLDRCGPGCSPTCGPPSRGSSRRGRPAQSRWSWTARRLVLGPGALRAARGRRRAAPPGAAARPDRAGQPLRRPRDGTWLGLDGYHAGETLRIAPDHLDLGTFVFTRTPYDPEAPVPGGVDERGWRCDGSAGRAPGEGGSQKGVSGARRGGAGWPIAASASA